MLLERVTRHRRHHCSIMLLVYADGNGGIVGKMFAYYQVDGGHYMIKRKIARTVGVID